MRDATATKNMQSMSVFSSLNFAIHLSNGKTPFEVSQDPSCGHAKTFRPKLNVATKPTSIFRRDNFLSAPYCVRAFDVLSHQCYCIEVKLTPGTIKKLTEKELRRMTKEKP